MMVTCLCLIFPNLRKKKWSAKHEIKLMWPYISIGRKPALHDSKVCLKRDAPKYVASKYACALVVSIALKKGPGQLINHTTV